MVFPTFFNLSLNLVIWSSLSEPQPAPGLVFADCIELLHFLAANNNMKKQKDRVLKDELLKLVGVQHATRDQWRNNFRKNEGLEPKQKQHPDVDVTGDRSKVRCCKEQYCKGTWDGRSMNQGRLEVVK